jgi:hypothetical protein
VTRSSTETGAYVSAIAQQASARKETHA